MTPHSAKILNKVWIQTALAQINSELKIQFLTPYEIFLGSGSLTHVHDIKELIFEGFMFLHKRQSCSKFCAIFFSYFLPHYHIFFYAKKKEISAIYPLLLPRSTNFLLMLYGIALFKYTGVNDLLAPCISLESSNIDISKEEFYDQTGLAGISRPGKYRR